SRPRDRELESGEAGEETPERDLDLGTGKRGAETEVDAVPEGDVRIRVPAEVQPLGILEHGRIAVRGGEAGEDHLAAAYRLIAERHVFPGEARLRDLRERQVSKELRHG